MEAEIVQFGIIALALAIPGYAAYLHLTRPWGPLKVRRKLHSFAGDEWVETEQGGMVIDEEEWRIYLYKIDDS